MAVRSESRGSYARPRYAAPPDIQSLGLSTLIEETGRAALADRQFDLLRTSTEDVVARVHYAGRLDVLHRPAVSIVGTRDVTEQGWSRAVKLARELAQASVTVVSGLAKGVDTAALSSALTHGGNVAAIIGTPLDKAYPAENGEMQTRIWRDHLLLSPFRVGTRTFPSSFPVRNRVMAALSDATVIIEASDTSGTLHQAAECQRLGRWLFIAKSVADDRSLTWPAKFLGKPKVEILASTDDLLAKIVRR